MVVRTILNYLFNFIILFPIIVLLYHPINKTSLHLTPSLVIAIIVSRYKIFSKEFLYEIYTIYTNLKSKPLSVLFWVYYLLIRIISIILILYFLFPKESKTNLDLLSFLLYFFIYLTYDISLSVIIWKKVINKNAWVKYGIRILIINNILGGLIGFFK
jgi:hypothetical protein